MEDRASESMPSEMPERLVRPPPRRPVRLGPLVRGAVLSVVFGILVTGFAYPILITGFAQLVSPTIGFDANGGFLYRNGTLVGSSYLAQNLSAPFLFWERPSLTDYNTTIGDPSPPGPTDPALGALLNETIAYMLRYGNSSVNGTFPLSLVSPSASNFDPQVPPDAALVQVPRVAQYTNLTIAFLNNFVNEHIVHPVLPGVGVEYVNILELDIDLLNLLGK